jgi:drug/metabolite transporter (DMT)-like permease
MPSAPPRVRLVERRDARATTDYLFDFWTALGWSVLSCGFYGFYIWYRMVERMRDHNRRRLELLEAANELAWERAGAQGRQDEMRAKFERVGADLAVMRQMTGDFREPAIWVVILLLGGSIGLVILYWLLDVDLIKHSGAEADAEWQLASIFDDLGVAAASAFGPPAPPPKPPHQYAARILVTLLTCGVYSYWWMYDLMKDANDHFHRDWAWEDALVATLATR